MTTKNQIQQYLSNVQAFSKESGIRLDKLSESLKIKYPTIYKCVNSNSLFQTDKRREGNKFVSYVYMDKTAELKPVRKERKPRKSREQRPKSKLSIKDMIWYSLMSMSNLRLIAKEKGLKVNPRISKAKLWKFVVDVESDS